MNSTSRRETWSDPVSGLGGVIVSARETASASLNRWVCRPRRCRCTLESWNERVSGRVKECARVRRSAA